MRAASARGAVPVGLAALVAGLSLSAPGVTRPTRQPVAAPRPTLGAVADGAATVLSRNGTAMTVVDPRGRRLWSGAPTPAACGDAACRSLRLFATGGGAAVGALDFGFGPPRRTPLAAHPLLLDYAGDRAVGVIQGRARVAAVALSAGDGARLGVLPARSLAGLRVAAAASGDALYGVAPFPVPLHVGEVRVLRLGRGAERVATLSVPVSGTTPFAFTDLCVSPNGEYAAIGFDGPSASRIALVGAHAVRWLSVPGHWSAPCVAAPATLVVVTRDAARPGKVRFTRVEPRMGSVLGAIATTAPLDAYVAVDAGARRALVATGRSVRMLTLGTGTSRSVAGVDARFAPSGGIWVLRANGRASLHPSTRERKR
jgi:hypothetical protein